MSDFNLSQYSNPLEGPKVARMASSQPGFVSPSLRAPLMKRAMYEAFVDELEKIAGQFEFTTSQYSGPLGPVRFPQVSSQPGFRQPSLEVPVEKKAAAMFPKGHSPAIRLSEARQVGARVTSPPGSVASLAKPRGFGSAIPGAANPNALRN